MAELEAKNIDGLATTFLPGVFDGKTHLHFFSNQLQQYLGIRAKYIDLLDFGGASALAMIHRARRAVIGGEAENVLCIIGGKASNIRTSGVTVDSLDKVRPEVSITPFDQIFRVYDDMNPVSDYALVASRHSKLFGTTDEQRAQVAVHQRRNAKNNPKALYTEELTTKKVLDSPLISDPLRLLEIVYPVDGFHAFIVSRKNRTLRNLDVLGYGEAHWPELPCELSDIVYTPATESAKKASYNMEKVDAFELYDSFTITVMLQLEDLGLTGKGQAGTFVERTDLGYSGEFPVNTGGGSLNVGQPAYMSGGVLLEEALLQLNDMASGHQVKDARVVCLNGIGGWNRSHSVTLILGEPK